MPAPASGVARGPALGLLELSLIARGVVVADAVVKRADVELVGSRPVPGGKHLVILSGGVEEIGEAMAAGREAAGSALVDRLQLAYLYPPIWAMLGPPVHPLEWSDGPVGAAAIVETATVCSAVLAADAAGKTAPVALRDMRLAVGISGKAFFTMTGDLSDIEAAAAAARDAAGSLILDVQVIPSPAPDLVGHLVF
ncbi:MAG TPA: BMC domain-containing protein [Kofleriaceae bacterium]|nr:BMC domain-containing protein [Kofleriaceae bacterium]